MSGFDGLFRTQALTGQWALEGARREESARQFDVSAFQQQQALDMRQAETDAKLGVWESEQQLLQHKLGLMTGLDAAKQSRLATEQAELALQRERMELELTGQRIAGEGMDAMKTMEEIRQIGRQAYGKTYQDRLAAGVVDDPSAPLGIRKDPEQAKRLATQAGDIRARLEKTNDPLERNRLGQELDRVLRQTTNPLARSQMPAEVRGILDQAGVDLAREYGGHFSGAQPVERPGGESQAPAPSQAAPSPVQSPFQQGSLPDTIWNHDRWTGDDPFWGELGKDPVTRQTMSAAMAMWGQSLIQEKGWRDQVDAEMFRAAEERPQVLGFILKISAGAGGKQRSDEDIRRVLRSRFGLDDKGLDFTMRYVDQAVEDLFRRDGGR